MSAVFKKLNLKEQSEIVVVNAPPSFEPEIAALRDVAVRRELGRLPKLKFSLAFVTKQTEVDALAKSITRRAEGDAIVWFAYPKETSKNYKSEINRDSGWRALNTTGFEGMRMVAIDDDWSALRFRRTELIKRADADPKKGRKPLRE